MLAIRMMVLLAIFACCTSTAVEARADHYGNNPAASGAFEHDGIRFYYETYGRGEPLLLVHGNGGSISDWSAQIAAFRKSYRVIAMDSRDQGRSGDSAGAITYEMMADDLAALIDHLHIAKTNVVGWSDGGIEALLLGMRHPARVNKIVAMAANLNPEAVWPETQAFIADFTRQIQASDPQSVQGRRDRKMMALLQTQPHIDPKNLNTMTAPTLILAGDHDLILDSHTLEIFHNLPKGQLGIFPDATHMIPYDDPARFNSAIDRFLRSPFTQRDRIGDILKSLEAIRPSPPAAILPQPAPSAR